MIMALAKRPSGAVANPIDPSQTLRAATALLRKIQSDQATRKSASEKSSLLADADEDEAEDDVPVWLVLTTKKHIIDKKRLKPGRIQLPHPYLNSKDSNLRVCLITADPQRKYKGLVADQSFPLDLAKKIGRVVGLNKLKTKYKSFESRRQLLGEYDVFLADDRIITSLPQVLGKTFYKTGSKRPVPVSLEGKRQSHDENGNKRRKLSEGGTKVVKSEVRPADVAREIERTLSSALVHLAPSTTTAVKVGKASMEPQQIQDNVEVVTAELVEKFVPQKWQNVRAVHMKGPNTAALPIWLAEELWEDEKDVLEEPPPFKETKKNKKGRRGALEEAANVNEASLKVIEVPGPDGKMRRLEKTSVTRKAPAAPVKSTKKRKSETLENGEDQTAERAEKAARKEALKKQKAAAKDTTNGVTDVPKARKLSNGEATAVRKVRAKAADLI